MVFNAVALSSGKRQIKENIEQYLHSFEMSQYIGKTISLISVTDNRYIGLLEDVDSDKGTVTLNEVRCFGTEGRRNWGPEEIYPNPTVYKSVKFNGNEVKDLSILDCKLDDVQPLAPPTGALQQPAGHTPQATQQQQVQTSPPQSQSNQPLSQGPASGQAQHQHQQHQQQQQQHQQQQSQQVPAAVAGYGVYAPKASETRSAKPARPASNFSSSNDQSFSKSRPHEQIQRRRGSHGKKVEIPSEDFDFQTNNAKFSKGSNQTVDQVEDSNSHSQESIERPTDSNTDDFYNKKSSFFDSISTSTESSTNMRWQEEKVMNLDTFGQASARPRFGGRGGNRGGRGRGRGRGRGGRGRGGSDFNNNDRSNYGAQNSRLRDTEF